MRRVWQREGLGEVGDLAAWLPGDSLGSVASQALLSRCLDKSYQTLQPEGTQLSRWLRQGPYEAVPARRSLASQEC